MDRDTTVSREDPVSEEKKENIIWPRGIATGKRCCATQLYTSRWRRKWVLFAGNVPHISTLKCDLYGRLLTGRFPRYFFLFFPLSSNGAHGKLLYVHKQLCVSLENVKVSKSGRMRSRGHTRRGNGRPCCHSTLSSHQDKYQSIRQLNLEKKKTSRGVTKAYRSTPNWEALHHERLLTVCISPC